MYDVIIIGGGPAGISAALYTLRANLNVLIIENGPNALAKAHKIDNYYGLNMSGKELYSTGLQQAKALGAVIIHDEVVGVEYFDSFNVSTKTQTLKARSVILATGTKSQTVKINDLAKFEGKGISYCAVCDGFFFRNKKVAVLGNGAYALHEADYLKHLAQSVTILTNGDDAKLLQNTAMAVNTKAIASVAGDDKFTGITFTDGSAEEFDGLFIALGSADSSDIARKLGAQLKGKFIDVNEDFSTNIPGLFAAGDCTGGFLQVAKAVYEGSLAGTAAIKFLRNQ